MNAEKLLIEIRKIVREELEIALSSNNNSNLVTSSKLKEIRKKSPKVKSTRPTKKSTVNERHNKDIKEKLAAIKNLQKQFNVDLSNNDLNEEKEEEFVPKNDAESALLETFNKDYSKVLEKTGDIKK